MFLDKITVDIPCYHAISKPGPNNLKSKSYLMIHCGKTGMQEFFGGKAGWGGGCFYKILGRTLRAREFYI